MILSGVDLRPRDLLTLAGANPITAALVRFRVRGVMFGQNWQRKATEFFLVAGLALATASLSAQQIDPRVLQQLGAGGGGANSSQRLDAAREIGADADDEVLSSKETDEERELRRLQSRKELESLYSPSPIEAEFRNRTGDGGLRLFGYDLFRSTEGAGAALTGSVRGSYVLGVGDELVVTFQGATNSSATARVDREGRLIVGQLPPVRAAGRTLADVSGELAAATRRTLLGTELSVSLGTVRSISILVGGEVERPGQYQMTAFADIASALSRAGGVKRGGTLRRVRIVRTNGAVDIVDLYGLLGIGTPPVARLQDGDRVIVPVIGETVAVTGGVARPGIYELRGPLGVQSLVSYAGGALRPRGYTLSVSRIGADGRENFLPPTGKSQTVVSGDVVQVIGGSAGGVVGRVALRGSVLNPGTRPLSTARTIRELVGDISDLPTGTYLPMAVLVRRDETTSAETFVPVNLFEALKDSPSVALRNDDKLYVFSQEDIRFLSRPAIRRIVLGQTNSLPQCRSLQRLESLVRDTQSARFTAVTRGSFIVDRGGQAELTVNAGAQSLSGARSTGTDVRSATDLLSDCRSVFEESVELLPILIENAVGVGGAIRWPGPYPVANATTGEILVSVGGGMIAGASDVVLDVIRSTQQSTTTSSIILGSDPAVLTGLLLRPGDDLRVNASQSQFESGAVLLSGEFRRPGLYAIRKGETLSQLITRAGGITEFAYPYGAVFTRRSVKELQQEGFRRTARELNNGLLVASARKTGSAGDSLAAAAILIDRLSTIEAPGRVVVEADPRILSARTDLDTILESGDALIMPKRPNFVLALGDVLNPGALQYSSGKSAVEYLQDAGGFQAGADRSRAFLVLPNGTASAIRTSLFRAGSIAVPPGSTIIVPKDLNPLKTLDLARDVSTIFGQFVTAIASVAILAAN